MCKETGDAPEVVRPEGKVKVAVFSDVEAVDGTHYMMVTKAVFDVTDIATTEAGYNLALTLFVV